MKADRFGKHARKGDPCSIDYSLGPDLAKIAEMANSLAVMAIEDTIRNSSVSVGYGKEGGGRPAIIICDENDHCFRAVNLKHLLEQQVSYYDLDLRPEIDGDPVDYRFSRFMLAAVRFFEKEEKAGRNPS